MIRPLRKLRKKIEIAKDLKGLEFQIEDSIKIINSSISNLNSIYNKVLINEEEYFFIDEIEEIKEFLDNLIIKIKNLSYRL